MLHRRGRRGEAAVEGDEFLRRMRAKDRSVWDDLYPYLRKVAQGACRDLRVFDRSVDDVVQDVSLKVFTRWESYRGDSKLGTWIYAIARNRCIDELARAGRQAAVVADLHVGDDDADVDDPLARLPDESLSNPEQQLCVQQVLAELDEEPPARRGSMRKIDVLRWWVEHSPSTEELAEFLQTSLSAAKERKSYILKHVRELCRRFCGHDECAFAKLG